MPLPYTYKYLSFEHFCLKSTNSEIYLFKYIESQRDQQIASQSMKVSLPLKQSLQL